MVLGFGGSDKRIKEIAEQLWKEPEEEHWKEFSSELGKSKIKYYKVVFGDKLSSEKGLKDSWAELYNDKYENVTKVPIFMNKGKQVEGATYYLKGLQVNNK